MRFHKSIFLLICVVAGLAFKSPLQAEKTTTIKEVSGRCYISNITPEEAKERAIQEAKKEALRQAGISETIRATDALTTEAKDADFKQVFNSFSTVELSGQVTDFEVINEVFDKDEFNNLYVEVTINAEVIKYDTQRDPSFEIQVDHIEPYYKEGNKLTFDFKPYKEGYLKIFLFDGEKTSYLLFPNSYEPNRQFRSDQVYSFPMSPKIDYWLETEKEQEVNHLVFVYTKTDIPFTKPVKYKNIISWINTISPDQRVVKYYNYMIQGVD